MQARIYVLVPSFAIRLLRLPSAAGIALALGPVWWSRCSSRWRQLILDLDLVCLLFNLHF